MKNKTDKIYLFFLCIIIAILNLFIGSNHQEPKTKLETAILITGLTYVIVKKIQRKKNIVIKGKIDIAMLVLTVAMFIPMLIKSYYSLNDTINYGIEFLCVYVLYILARNLLKSQKEVNIIIDVTLVSSILIIIFGLDKLYFNVFKHFLDIIGSAKSNAYGMVSTIGYSNPLAAYMSLLSFFALGRYLYIENKWIKAIYSCYIQIAMIGFVFGNSRALMVMYPIVFIIYLFILKDNHKRLQSIMIILINILDAFVFQEICNKVVINNIILWLIFIINLIFIYLLSLIINKIITSVKVKFKINNKKLLITIISIILIIIAYCNIVKGIGESVVVDKNKKIELLGLKNNENYNIKINLNVTTASNLDNETVNLIVTNHTSKRSYKKVKNIALKNGEQNLEFNIQTDNDFERMRVFSTNLTDENNKVKINHIYINNKEYIMKYKYLPNDVIRMLRTLNFRTVSIYERIAFCKDSLKLAKNNLVFGSGGCAFANHIKLYQTYVHGYNKESHSYILDLLLNYGIFGIITYISVLVITILNAYKTIKKYRKKDCNYAILFSSILIGLILFTIHAMVDYDLNYLVTLSIYYITIAIINKEDKIIEQEKNKIIISMIDYIVIIAIILVLTLTIPRCYSDYLVKQKKYEEAYNFCKYSEPIKFQMIEKAYKDNNLIELDKFITLYIKDEKYKRNFYILDKFQYLTIANLRKGKNNIAVKNMEDFYKYITENNNISKINNQEIKQKKKIIFDFTKEVGRNTEALKDEKIVHWYNKFQMLNKGT